MAFSLAMILLDSLEPELSQARFAAELAARWPDLPRCTDADAKEGTQYCRIGAADVILGHMPAPIPACDIDSALELSLLWPNAEEELPRQASHLIVTVSGEPDPLRRARLLTQAVAALLVTCRGGLGVYWGDAAHLIRKELFVDFAHKILPHGPPLHIWVNTRVGRTDDDRRAGYTIGLAALDRKEFEAVDSPESIDDLRERLLSLAEYVLERGPVIRDGDTVGQDTHERIRVVAGESRFGLPGTVLRLVYEQNSPDHPW